MGMHADDCLNETLQHEMNFQNYSEGNLSLEEAYEFGLIDERGYAPKELVDSSLRLGVMDAESLENELALCEGAFKGSSSCLTQLLGSNFLFKQRQKSSEVIHYWRSGTKLLLPKDMTNSHLENAITYCKKNGIEKTPIAKNMVKELKKRKSK